MTSQIVKIFVSSDEYYAVYVRYQWVQDMFNKMKKERIKQKQEMLKLNPVFGAQNIAAVQPDVAWPAVIPDIAFVDDFIVHQLYTDLKKSKYFVEIKKAPDGFAYLYMIDPEFLLIVDQEEAIPVDFIEHVHRLICEHLELAQVKNAPTS
jgi:hypothetical protein